MSEEEQKGFLHDSYDSNEFNDSFESNENINVIDLIDHNDYNDPIESNENINITPDDDDSIFEESILKNSFPIISTNHDEDDEDDDSLFDLSDHSEASSYTDLVDLRGLFDEDAVDPDKIDSTLDFEEIPDDIDIDEPIEVEQLTRTDRIMNVVVKATLVMFALIILGFIINSALVIGAVLSSNFQIRAFIDVSDLDRKVGNIDVTLMTEVSNFGSFIDGELDPIQPVRVRIYLSENEENPLASDAICDITYQPPKDKNVLKFNGGQRNIFNLRGIELRLNPNFDAGRLSGFMEPRDGSSFHPRYPRKLIIRFSANLVIKSFWIPIPYEIETMSKVEMDKIDPVAEEKRAADMKAFDFNPKFIKILRADRDKILIQARQPVPKFFAPPFYQVALHLPAMNLVVKQFTLKDPQAPFDVESLFHSQSHPLATLKTEPFRLLMADGDLTPNIVDLTAEIRKNQLSGLLNVLKAIRDADLSTLAFFFASTEFVGVEAQKSNDTNNTNTNTKSSKNSKSSSKKNSDAFKEDTIDGCSLNEFLHSFWGRQLYPTPASTDEEASKIPSIPELYNPVKDSAMKFEFQGLSTGPPATLNFTFTANNHFLITQYKLPLLMLSGPLPPIHFKMQVKTVKKQNPVALISCKHHQVNDGMNKEFTLNIQIQILDLKLLTHFVMKLYRLWRVSSGNANEISANSSASTADASEKAANVQKIVGKMFKGIEGAEIVANYRDNPAETWISEIASVFDLKFDLTDRAVKFVYSGNDRAVIPETPVKRKSITYSEDAEAEIGRSLNSLLGVDLETIKEAGEDEEYEKAVLKGINELKVAVEQVEKEFHQASQSKENFASQAKEACDDELKASAKAASISVSVQELIKAAAKKSTSALDSHHKLDQVRDLLIKRLALLKAQPVSVDPIQNNLIVNLDSTEGEFLASAALALHESNRLYDDHMVVEWSKFDLDFSNPKSKKRLAQLQMFPASFKLSLNDSSISSNTFNSNSDDIPADDTDSGDALNYHTHIKSIRLNVLMGPDEKDTKATTLPVWMKSLKDFYEALLDVNNYFVPLEISINSAVSWETELPSAGIPIPSNGARQKLLETKVEPGFFDNLAKSHFDFIGYGFYRLIFHAILPNPDECPAGSSLLNVELNLPPISTYLHMSADTGDLKAGKFVAAVNTARPLRLWTQIVDGVLCNGYAVSEGLEEQELAIQARIPRSKSSEIIESFSRIIELHDGIKKAAEKKKDPKSPSETSDSTTDSSAASSKSKAKTPSEDPVIHYGSGRSKKYPTDLSQIALEKRFALITAVPVSIEIFNFEHLIKIIDAFGEKRLVTIGTEDPTKEAVIPGRSQPSLFNVLVSALASRFPVSFNTPEQITLAAKAGAAKVIRVSDEKVVLDIDPKSPSPTELDVKIKISMPDRLKGTQVEGNDETENSTTGYIPFETVNPERRFKHPIIRWGRTELTFTFPKFLVNLKLSPGTIEVTNDGSEILFDGLKDLTLHLGISGKSEEASRSFESLFRVASIRQIFKRCEDYYKKLVDYEFKETSVIGTTSKVVYGKADKQKFHFLGSADIESFYLLQAVILRRVFSQSKGKDDLNAADDDEDIGYDNDPTRIDFGMLISLGRNKKLSGESNENLSSLTFKELRSKIPRVGMPCFFKNFCSAEQLTRTTFDRDGLTGRFDHIPVNLHIRNTFQPIAEAMAAGFATFLSLFHMPTYPKTFEWVLRIPKEQVIGVEMNGFGIAHGIAGPLTIVKSAEIPYPRSKPDLIVGIKSSKKYKKLSRRSRRNDGSDYDDYYYNDSGEESFRNEEKYKKFVENELTSFVFYDMRSKFEKNFSRHLRDQKFKDEVIIPIRAQLPDSMPELTRELLWPMFFIPIQTITLHPPLVNVENAKPDELAYPPIAIGLSDSMNFKDKHGHVIRPSLLARLFAGFIAEESSTGLEVHKLNFDNVPSTFKFHWTGSFVSRNDWVSLGKDLIFSDMDDFIHVVVWTQYTWPLGSIGFDFGSKIRGQIYLHHGKSNEKLFIDGFLSSHVMIGKMARMRIDLVISKAILIELAIIPANLVMDRFSSLVNYLWSSKTPWDTAFQDIPVRVEFNVDDNFLVETEAIIPKTLFVFPPPLPTRQAGKVKLYPTKRNIDSLIGIYSKEAPQAIACVYNNKVLPEDEARQSLLWSQLDLSRTHMYFADISSIKPGDDVQLFFQLRTVDSIPVCGHLLAYEGGLAVMIEYIKPKHAFKQLYSSLEQSPRVYIHAEWDPSTSIYAVKTRLYLTGHYRVYVALLKRADERIESARYRLVEYSTFYVQHTR